MKLPCLGGCLRTWQSGTRDALDHFPLTILKVVDDASTRAMSDPDVNRLSGMTLKPMHLELWHAVVDQRRPLGRQWRLIFGWDGNKGHDVIVP